LIENQHFKHLLVDYPQLSLKMIKPCLSGYTLQNSNPCCYLLVPQKTGYSISFVRKPSWWMDTESSITRKRSGF